MDIKKLAIIIGPVILSAVIYFVLSYNKGASDGISNQYHTNSIIDPKATDTTVIKSKSRIYEMKLQNDAQKRNQKAINNDDFFGGTSQRDTATNIYGKSNYSNLNNSKTPVDSTLETEKRAPLLDITKEKEGEKKIVIVKREKKKDLHSSNTPKKKERSFHSSFDTTGQNEEYNETQTKDKTSSAYISGVVHDKTTVRSGQKVHIRLTEDASIAGYKVPKNTDLSGVVSINNERVMVKISSFELNGKLIFVKLTVFDQDGVEGIYAEGGINHEVTLSTITSGMQAGATKIPTIGSYIGQAGTRKVSDPSVTIYSGHKVYIQEIKQ